MKSYLRVIFVIVCIHLKICSTQVSPSLDCEVWNIHSPSGRCNNDQSTFSFSRNGTISDGDGPYGNVWRCGWWWQGNTKTILQFTSFDTQSPNDIVTIMKLKHWDDRDISYGITLLEASGSIPLSNIYSTDDVYTYLVMSFKTGNSVPKQGFVANWWYIESLPGCSKCLSGQYLDLFNSCLDCPANSLSPAGSVEVTACICTAKYPGPAGGPCGPCAAGHYNSSHIDAFLLQHRPFIASDALEWNMETRRFDSLCGGRTCNGNTGEWQTDPDGWNTHHVVTGTVTGHGAHIAVPYVGGDDRTLLQWGAGSIPSSFTICSVTRYSGENRARILACPETELGFVFYHGHSHTMAGVNCYGCDFWNNEMLSIPVNTNWVAMCGSNVQNATRPGIIVNNVVRAQGNGGEGNCALNINGQWGLTSDWQLSKLYIWNYHLSASNFAHIASMLHADTISGTPGVCRKCPVNSDSLEGTISQTGCRCNAGYTWTRGEECSACPANHYKTVSGPAPCSLCPSNSISLAASSAITDCVCKALWSGPNGGPCVQCTVGTYAAFGTCLNCAANSISPTLSVGITACRCNAGYTGTDGGICTQCHVNQFKAALGNATCTNCPLISVSPAGSIIRTACRCDTGWTGPDGGPCNMCLRGTYKSFVGSSACERCPANSISPTQSISVTSCLCDAGYMGANRDSCSPCNEGHHKPVIGFGSCIACPVGIPANIERTLCGECSAGAYFANSKNFARACGPTQGSACPITGVPHPSVVSRVNDGKFDLAGGVSNDNAYPTIANPNILYIDFEETRRVTRIIYYKRITIDMTGTRIMIGWNQTWSENAECAVLNSESVQTHKCDLSGRYIFLVKDWNFFLLELEVFGTCMQCPANSISPFASLAVTACQCNAGYSGMDGGICTQCGMHQTKAGLGSGACQCNAGYTGMDGGICTQCGIHQTKAELGSGPCQCNAGYSGMDGGICTQCGIHQTKAGLGPGACQCNAGYTGMDGGTCTQCGINQYKEVLGNADCTDCPSRSSSPAGSIALSTCVCNAGSNGRNGAICVQCLNGTYKSFTGNTGCVGCELHSSSPLGSIAISACVCNAGSTGPDGGTCTQCLANTYKSLAGNTSCLNCPSFNSNSPTGSVAITACVCNAGWSGPNGGTCTQCLGNTYKSLAGNTSCLHCPAHSSSPPGSIDITACVCNAGSNGPNGATCVQCLNGTYKPFAGNTGCVGCELHSSSPLGSISISACVCNAGSTGPDGGTCTQCSANTYKSLAGNTNCQFCALNSNSPAGSIGIAACICRAGWSGLNGGTCTECPGNTYKSLAGNTSCLDCPSRSSSPPGSMNVTACVCNAGSDGPNGATCVQCLKGTYKPLTGNTGCTKCHSNSNSPTESIISSACLCNGGYSGTTTCVTCPLGTHRPAPWFGV